MAKKKTIEVQGVVINITNQNEEDYICLTDMVRDEEGNDHIRNWLRNRNTVEFIGIWEQLNNDNFKGVEFDTLKKESGLNSFNLTPKKWIELTNAIGIVSKSGRNGGTYAHRDIAFEFGAWLSPIFKLHLIKEYQRLKEIEQNQYGLEWNVRRILSKTNYRIHTDAIKDYIIPKMTYSKAKEFLVYANEADLLNVALFGCTAKQWKESNPSKALDGENVRDMASINELAILSNIESLNSTLIKMNTDKKERLKILIDTVTDQRKILDSMDVVKSLKKEDDNTFIKKKENKLSDFNSKLSKALGK